MKKFIHFAFLIISSLLLCHCKTTKNKSQGSGQTAAKLESKPSAATPSSTSGGVGDLDGEWTFGYFPAITTSATILFPANKPTITFELKAKKFYGNAGCNNFSGVFTVKDNNLTFTQPMIVTRMACNASGENRFLEYLKTTEKFSISADELNLYGADGKAHVVMKKVKK